MSELVNILLEGDREPLGFIEITPETTLDDARKSIEAEIEDLPTSFRFLFLNRDILVKVSLRQESKTKAMKATTKSCLVLRPVVEIPDAKEESSVSLDKYLTKAQKSIDTSKVNVVIDSDHTQAVRKFWREMDHHIKETLPTKAKDKKKRLSYSARSGSNLSSDCDSDDSGSSQPCTPETPQRTLTVDSIALTTASREDDQPENLKLDSKSSVAALSTSPSPESQPTPPKSDQINPAPEYPTSDSQSKDTPSNEPPTLKRDSSNSSDTTITEEAPSPLSVSPNSSYGSIADAFHDEYSGSSALLRSRMSKTRSTILKLEGFIQNRPTAQTLADKHILDSTTISDLSSVSPSPTHSMSFAELMIKSPLIRPDFTWRVELAGMKSAGGITSLEFLDKYEHYYKECFSTEGHSNYLGEHPKTGPTVVSIMDDSPYQSGPPFVYPAIIRSEKYDDRVFLDLNKKPKHKSDLIRALKTSFPHLLSNTKFSKCDSSALQADLIKYEQDQIIKNMKVGVLYCSEGQTTDDEMFNNDNMTDSFKEFLDFLGDKVELQGFKGYSGGLDVKTNTTGTHSIYTKFLGLEIMFHVSTMLPFFPNDPQQVERKRHLGNDIVVVVFKQGKTPFEPSVIKTQFNHVFVVVQLADPEDVPVEERGHTHYQIAVCSKRDVPPFGPPIQARSIFKKDIHFRDFLLTKLLNAERASMVAPIFSKKMEYARKQLLTYMCTNPYPEEDNHSGTSDSDLENTLLFHGVAQPISQVTVSVKGHDFDFKTSVDPNTQIGQFIDKIEKRVPLSQHGYGLYFDGELMDREATWMKYKFNFSKLKVEFYPFISPGEPKQIKHLDNDEVPMRRRFLTFSKKSDSFKLTRRESNAGSDTDPTLVQKNNPLFTVNSSSSESPEETITLGNRPKSKTVSGPSSSAPPNLLGSPSKLARAVQRTGSDTVGVVSVTVRSPTLEVSIKVQASSTVANLLEKISVKFPDNPTWKLTKDGKSLNPSDLVDSLKPGFDAVTVDYGPEDKSTFKKTLRKSFLH